MNTGRISGISSGMDTEQIVKDLMKIERQKVDRMGQDKQLLEWKRDDYRDMNRLLDDFNRSITDGLMRQSSFNKKIVNSSNSSAVTARNINSTSDVNTKINVYQLAESAYINSSGSIVADPSNFDPNKKLSEESSKFNNYPTETTFSIQSIKADGTLGEVVNFTFDPNVESLNSVLSKINNSNAGVSTFYDSQTGKISMVAKNTGAIGDETQPEIILTGDFLTTTLGLGNDNLGANGSHGQNASFKINGLDTTRTSNTFIINGYEYTLHQVTDNNDGIVEAGEQVTISSQTDVDTIYKSIKDFVDKYNETIDKINKELSEERYRDYRPLTSDERKALDEYEIKLWDEKARSGTLRNDPTLNRGLSQMRTDIYTPVSGLDSSFNQLSEIGITTSSNYREKGKLIIDEAKLREAIAADPMAVSDLFNKDGATYEEQGIARRLKESSYNTIKNIESTAGNELKASSQFSLGREMDRLDKRIMTEEARLINIENRYWREFTRMEQMVEKWYSQGDFLASIGGY